MGDRGQLADPKRGMAEERKGSQPDVMSFLAGRGELESSFRSQYQDGSIEVWSGSRASGRRVVVPDIKNGLDIDWPKVSNVCQLATSYLRFRPLFPIKADPEVGCLLLHKTALSYGASHTHRLWRTPVLVTLADISSPFLARSHS